MKYERIIVNFDEACKISCPFCYLPFKGQPPDFALLDEVLQHSKELGFSVVTFSGGDPFDYSRFRDLVVDAHNLGFEIHIDTNAVSLEPRDYPLIAKYVSLIGFPIDGPNATIHDALRKCNGHFSRVIYHIGSLHNCAIRIKINTLVTAHNSEFLPLVYDLICQHQICIWSIFQFMALADASNREKEYAIDDDAFESIIERTIRTDTPFTIEIGRARERRRSYFFVSLDGQVYTHSRNDPMKYVNLGHFLSNEWEEKYWAMNQATITEGARARYRALSKATH